MYLSHLLAQGIMSSVQLVFFPTFCVPAVSGRSLSFSLLPDSLARSIRATVRFMSSVDPILFSFRLVLSAMLIC